MEDPMAIDKKLIDQLLADYRKPEDIIGENALLKELTKAILERALHSRGEYQNATPH
jgi:putative transposase